MSRSAMPSDGVLILGDERERVSDNTCSESDR